MSQTTMETDRRVRRRNDTQLATTYQLDKIRKDEGYRAIILTTKDGHMLAGSMGERLAKVLSHFVARIGTSEGEEREELARELIEEHLGEGNVVHVRPLEVGGLTVYLGIVSVVEAEVDEPIERAVSGVQRIYATT